MAQHPLKILTGLVFYPRGGSAQVARYLSRALITQGHDVRLVAGTIDDGDPQHDARVFYGDLPLTLMDYTDALHRFEQGHDPIAPDLAVPFHPSYEDKPGVPDRAFFKVSEGGYHALVRSWRTAFEEVSKEFQPDVLHLHHVNHMHRAASEVFPSVPALAQLHGTEIKMLEHLRASAPATELEGKHCRFWPATMSEAARAMKHLVAISPDVRQRAMAELSLEPPQVTTIANGVDLSLFRPQDWTAGERLDFLRKILVEEPRGWDESGTPGSIRYAEADLARFRHDSGDMKPIAIFVGRFLDFKRVPLLLRAVARVNQMFAASGDDAPFNLLVWGGMPGEWEGEHPYTIVRSLGLPNVFFTGWLPHDVLSTGFNLPDFLVVPSFFEPFGQVFLEAMATARPVIATRSGGPLEFVVDSGPTANGWLCEVDDVESLAQAIHAALRDEAERRRRGSNALELVRRKYEWSEIAREYVRMYRRIIGDG